MKINIQTPGFKAQSKLIRMVKSNVEKLGALSDRIQEAQVYLSVNKSATLENKVCEIRLVIPGNDLFSSKQSKNLMHSVTEACSALRHQIAKWKGIHSNKNHRKEKNQPSVD